MLAVVELVTDTSAPVPATEPVVTVEVLFPRSGSVVAVLTSAVLLMVVPFGVPCATMTTTVKLAESPAGSVPIDPSIVPVPPTVGLERLNAGPEVCSAETNVVLAGTRSESATLWASLGPVSETVIVYGIGSPASTGPGAIV